MNFFNIQDCFRDALQILTQILSVDKYYIIKALDFSEFYIEFVCPRGGLGGPPSFLAC
jgi:hypothetical protein